MVVVVVVVSVEEKKKKIWDVYILGRCGPELTVDKSAWSWLTAGRK